MAAVRGWRGHVGARRWALGAFLACVALAGLSLPATCTATHLCGESVFAAGALGFLHFVAWLAKRFNTPLVFF